MLRSKSVQWFPIILVTPATAILLTIWALIVLIGVLPEFDLRRATVNKDSALVCSSVISTYVIVCLIKRGFEMIPALLASVSIELAFLSKINADSRFGRQQSGGSQRSLSITYSQPCWTCSQ